MTPVITERLTLRCVEPADAEAFARLITPEISRWTGAWPCPLDPDFAAKKIEAALAKAASGDMLPFAITRDGLVLGWISVTRKAEEPGRGVLSYWLGEAFQRQGILREAGTAAIQTGFERLALAAIEATTHPGNDASAATLQRLGLVPFRTGTVWAETRQRHEVCDYYHISRLAG